MRRWWTPSGGPTTRSAFYSAAWEAARPVRERVAGAPDASSSERLDRAAARHELATGVTSGVLSMRRPLSAPSQCTGRMCLHSLSVWAEEARVGTCKTRLTVREAVAVAHLHDVGSLAGRANSRARCSASRRMMRTSSRWATLRRSRISCAGIGASPQDALFWLVRPSCCERHRSFRRTCRGDSRATTFKRCLPLVRPMLWVRMAFLTRLGRPAEIWWWTGVLFRCPLHGAAGEPPLEMERSRNAAYHSHMCLREDGQGGHQPFLRVVRGEEGCRGSARRSSRPFESMQCR